MFKVTRIRGKIPNVLTSCFPTYEKARSAVRKYIRTLDKQSWFGVNPSISEYGFSIINVG